MRVLYDYQAFTIQNYGGISRYFSELIKRFPYEDSTCDIGILFSNNVNYSPNFIPRTLNFLPDLKFKGKVKILSKINEIVTSKCIKKNDFDLFHPTYYNANFINKLENKPFVITIYDLIHEKLSQEFPEFKNDHVLLKNRKSLLEKSSKIIAISDTTKKDIIDLYGIDSTKIEVIHLGNSFVVNDRSKFNRLINYDYILFVGNRSYYKNFEFFIETIADLLINYNLKLVCAGGGDFSLTELNLISFLGLNNSVISKSIISDDILQNYYENAILFCFPSLYEGFGLPVLESFASRCPVLLSNRGSLPEIGGDAAIYFDPYDKQSLYVSTNSLITDENFRKTLVTRGSLRVKKFTWENTFKQTLELYKNVVEEKTNEG
jgi:glycosyltransferase involved in cell wall biosynthesis